MNLSKSATSELLYASFNQDAGCFSVGTDSGFRIYNCEPYKETFRRDFSSGGIGIVEMLFRCNILALVGGGRSPRFPTSKVMIWDDHQNRCIGELSFRTEVKAVRLRRDRVVVVLQHKIYVYNFADLGLISHIETLANPKGLCGLSSGSAHIVLACPGMQKGHVRVELFDIGKSTFIDAHETDLACLALNPSGTRLATASEKGTLVRVYDTATGDLLQELRRGTDRADIYCICFNPPCTLLACSSDKGTTHVFRLKRECHDDSGAHTHAHAGAASSVAAAGGAGAGAGGMGMAGSSGVTEVHEPADVEASLRPPSSTTRSTAPPSVEAVEDSSVRASTLSFVKGFLPKYFSSEWSFAQFRVGEFRSICAFGSEPNTIIVLTSDGGYHKTSFEKGGEALPGTYVKFIAAPGADSTA